MKFHEDILNGFQVTKQTGFCDGQTDGQMDGQTNGWIGGQTTRAKTICLPTLKGGDTIQNR